MDDCVNETTAIHLAYCRRVMDYDHFANASGMLNYLSKMYIYPPYFPMVF